MSEFPPPSSLLQPTSLDEVASCVRQSSGRIRIEGNGTKPGLSATQDEAPLVLSTKRLAGITDYQPTEFTITVLGGTPLATIDTALAAEGQYLPFDPPWISQGATIGGTIAAGLSGPARLRYGGARDFMLGVRIVDGSGTLVTGGGKVVKNAAGFDIPKMVVGSCGRLGVLVELTLKVFPRPATYRSLLWRGRDLDHALGMFQKIMRSGCELTALDLLPAGAIWLRFSGPDEATRNAITSVREQLDPSAEIETLDHGAAEQEIWEAARDAHWVPVNHRLIKVPITLQRLPEVDRYCAGLALERRYSSAGNLAWIAWPEASALDGLSSWLTANQLSALVIRGKTDRCELGEFPSAKFAERLERAIDPTGRFR